MKIGILGYGEVGQAISELYDSPSIKDLERDDGLENSNILNICIPFSQQFVEIVSNEMAEINPDLTIIHSTVIPGTTEAISKITGLPIVHSPIRGVHPNLYEGVLTFVKYIGSNDDKSSELAKKHLESLNLSVKVLSSSRSTELGKLLDTTYYGIVIAWHGEMKRLCDQLDVNFDEAVTDFNKTYNAGYDKLGKSNVIRPVLYPPDGKIGGHCIIPNAKLLEQLFASLALDLLKEYE